MTYTQQRAEELEVGESVYSLRITRLRRGSGETVEYSVFEDGLLVGSMSVKFFDQPRRKFLGRSEVEYECVFDSLGTRKNAEKGTGTELMRRGFEECLDKGVDKVFFTITPGYQCGFENKPEDPSQFLLRIIPERLSQYVNHLIPGHRDRITGERDVVYELKSGNSGN